MTERIGTVQFRTIQIGLHSNAVNGTVLSSFQEWRWPLKPNRKVVPSEEKERQILEAAQSVFFEKGFDQASTDEIARRARVSKATLYGYFPEKRALFVAFMERTAEASRASLFRSHSEQPVKETLAQVGKALLSMLVSPKAQGIFRLAIAESVRFPELRQTLYHSGQEQGTQQIANLLAQATTDGELNALNPDLAAAQFIELCRADLFYKVTFGIIETPSQSEVEKVVEAAVETFMARYGPTAPGFRS
ncbi:TetR/AcrR family transcriptional regulator [Thioclava sp. BHET1]|nr:TetR/AcrR family transcriptional regulator [Thioclava sp. BHET1]